MTANGVCQPEQKTRHSVLLTRSRHPRQDHSVPHAKKVPAIHPSPAHIFARAHEIADDSSRVVRAHDLAHDRDTAGAGGKAVAGRFRRHAAERQHRNFALRGGLWFHSFVMTPAIVYRLHPQPLIIIASLKRWSLKS